MIGVLALFSVQIEAIEACWRFLQDSSLLKEELRVSFGCFIGTNALEFIQAIDFVALHSDNFLGLALS